MKAVILAAGEGVRMRPLTLKVPKPMLKIAGQPILEHILNSLPEEIDEIILVIGHLGEKIKNYFGESFSNRKISYVIQEKKTGTYDALKLCRPFLADDNFMLMYADDLHSASTLKKCIQRDSPCVVLKEVEDPKRFGVALLNPGGTIKEIEEKPEKPKSNLAASGPYVLNKKIFNYPPPERGGEYYLAESINLMARKNKIYGIRADWWLPIGYPEDLKKAEEFLERR